MSQLLENITEHSELPLKGTVTQGGRRSTGESINIKNAINKYNIKLSELRKRMQNEAVVKFGPTISTNRMQSVDLSLVQTGVHGMVKRRAESGENLQSIEVYNPETNLDVLKKFSKQDSKKDTSLLYKNYSMRNKFTDPVFYVKRKNKIDSIIKPIDVVTQEKINKQVLKKFERANDVDDYYRHYEPPDPSNVYKKFNMNPYKTATSIYSILNKRKNDYMDEIAKKTENTFYPAMGKWNRNIERTKLDFFKNNGITHHLEKKSIDNIPIVFPTNFLHNKTKGLSLSQKSRYEKLTKIFTDLKYFIDQDEENEKELVKEFLMKQEIYDRDLYAIDKLNNFLEFLRSDKSIDPKKTLKQIIYEALLGSGADDYQFFNVHNNMSSTNYLYNSNISGSLIENSNRSIALNPINQTNLSKKYANNSIFSHNKSLSMSSTCDQFGKKNYNNNRNNSQSLTHVNFGKRGTKFGSTSQELINIELTQSNLPLKKLKTFKNSINYKNKRDVITKIEEDLYNNDILKPEDLVANTKTEDFYDASVYRKSRSSSPVENESIVVQNRKKKKENMKYDEQMAKIKKKGKLLDFIMLQRTKNLYFLESEGLR